HQPAGPRPQQLPRARLRPGRRTEPAAQLARRWLLAQNLGVPDESSVGDVPVTLRVGWWAAFWLRRRLRRIWRLAAGRSPGAINPAGAAVAASGGAAAEGRPAAGRTAPRGKGDRGAAGG